MKKRILILSMIVFFFCRPIAGDVFAGSFPAERIVSMEDAAGVEGEVRLPVKKLVVLTSDALEVIRSLGASQLVVGVYSDITKNARFWPGLRDRPKVGTWKEVNYERLVELKPDAVLCYRARPGRDMERKLLPFGIQVIRLDFFKPGILEKEVKFLGRILGKEKEAAELAEWYRDHLTHVRDILTGRVRPKVYIEGDSNYHTAGPGSGGNDMCVLAGGSNIAATLSIPYPEVTSEWILTCNPDVIVKVTTRSACGSCYNMTDARNLEKIRNRVITRPAWAHTNAVKKGRVHVIANDIWTGPRAVIGMYYMVQWFFPDAAVTLPPKALHRQYLEEFQGVPYQGVYIYPDK